MDLLNAMMHNATLEDGDGSAQQQQGYPPIIVPNITSPTCSVTSGSSTSSVPTQSIAALNSSNYSMQPLNVPAPVTFLSSDSMKTFVRTSPLASSIPLNQHTTIADREESSTIPALSTIREQAAPTTNMIQVTASVATNIHLVVAGSAPWPQKPALNASNSARRTVFETSLFIAPEPMPPEMRATEIALSALRLRSILKGGPSWKPSRRRFILDPSPTHTQTTPSQSVNVVTETPPDVSEKNKIINSNNISTGIGFLSKCPHGDSGISERRIRWNLEGNVMWPTWPASQYNRRCGDYIARHLTPTMATLIKMELNEVKREMPVHENAKAFTQFYPIGPQAQRQR